MLQFTGERFIPTQSLSSDEIGIEHLHRYHSVIPFIRNKTVLDIACGEGYGTALIGKFAKKATGVDIDEACIEWASGNYASNNDKLSFIKGSVSSIPLDDNSIDVVISFETIEHVTEADQRLFMLEIKRVLKTDGLLIISTPNTEIYSTSNDSNNPFHVKEFNREEFRSFLKEHFAHTKFFEQGYEVMSAITGEETSKMEEVRVINWERESRKTIGKYLITIASDKEIEDIDKLSSVVFQTDKEYRKLIDYIFHLEKEQGNLNKQVTQLSAAVTDKEKIISQLNSKILELYKQIERLNDRLSEIHSSDGWKLLTKYYRLKAKLMPEHSGRYKMLKKLINKLRNKRTDGYQITDFTDSKIISNPFEEILNFDIIDFPVYEDPRVSIIIPAYNGWEMNYRCLRSIYNNTSGVSYEIIFADDNSTDETANISNYIKNIRVIRNEQNQGFLKNCNHAASFAKGEYIHFLNNDTIVLPGWLSSLSELMDNDRQIGLAGSKLVYPNGNLQEAGGIIWQDGSGWNFGHNQNPDAAEYNYVKEVDYISGASILVRRSCWEKLGAFDERYVPAYYEDTDLAFAIRDLNMKVVYQPLSTVIHFEGFSHGTDNNSGLTTIKSYQQVNKNKFIEKWNKVLLTKPANGVDPFWARDNSFNKKTIVVIDHYVPHYDKDAGSRLTFRQLELLVELGYNIKFIGDNFYKQEPYTSTLQQMGIEVLYGTWYSENWEKWITDNQKYIDYFYINRPHISLKYIDALRSIPNKKIVYFGHDLHYLREMRQYEIEKNPELLKSADKWKKIESELVQKSDVVLTLSSDEKKLLDTVTNSEKIHILPAYYFSSYKDPVQDFSKRKNILFVGGFNHQPNVDAVLWFTKEVFPLIHKKQPDIIFYIAGSNAPVSINQLASSNVKVLGYVSDDKLTELYDNIKIVVIPLRYGAGVKGKTIEAMHHAVPIVTTDIGIEGLSNIHEVIPGYNTPKAFATALVELYNDNNKLVELSSREVEYANKYLSKESVKELFLDVFK